MVSLGYYDMFMLCLGFSMSLGLLDVEKVVVGIFLGFVRILIGFIGFME